MSRVFTVNVNECFECPMMREAKVRGAVEVVGFCSHSVHKNAGRMVREKHLDKDGFPEWCPLDKAK